MEIKTLRLMKVEKCQFILKLKPLKDYTVELISGISNLVIKIVFHTRSVFYILFFSFDPHWLSIGFYK